MFSIFFPQIIIYNLKIRSQVLLVFYTSSKDFSFHFVYFYVQIVIVTEIELNTKNLKRVYKSKCLFFFPIYIFN